jgi:uncharacterized repeat protein (TIGR03803 family)
MRCISFAATLLLLFGAMQARAADIYDSANKQLSIPVVAIGSATYSNMLVTVASIVSGPSGATPNGAEDSYDPGTNELTIQSVTVGSATYHNVVVTVAGLLSIGSVSGADSYNGSELSISDVQVGGITYDDVVIAVGGVVAVNGGMPTFVPDTYNSLTNQLAIPAVQVGGRVVTNVVITAGKLISVHGVGSTLGESIVHSFSGQYGISGTPDGAYPQAGLIQDSHGNLYGTTNIGGTHNSGTVFEITSAGTESVLYSFTGNGGILGNPDGADPQGGVTLGRDGNFYGTTLNGGLYNQGTVFRVTPLVGETVLYAFQGSTDGANPKATVIEGVDGNYYGTTSGGGAENKGTVFKITPGAGETVLHVFGSTGSTDGAAPAAALTLASDGNFYGTTSSGGMHNEGTVFRITPAGEETVLYSFSGGGGVSGSTDGADPVAGLIQGSDGNFYGTTDIGGAYNWGAVYRISSAGDESVLYSFSGQGGIVGSTDGAEPRGALIQASDGNFYGTTFLGGTWGWGTVFKLTPDGIETVLYSFIGNSVSAISPDGAYPYASLVQGSDGYFYGTTSGEGGFNDGIVFRLSHVIPF